MIIPVATRPAPRTLSPYRALTKSSNLLDAYSGYHQIPLNPADQLKTAFITPYGAYCYTTMPFGLKNVGATYQRCMQKCLHNQIGRNAHAYVDDIVIKTKEKQTLLGDLKETFDNLRCFQMKLNPEKCVFDNYSVSLYRHEESKPTRRKSPPSTTCVNQKTSRTSKNAPVAWPPSAGLGRRLSRCTTC